MRFSQAVLGESPIPSAVWVDWFEENTSAIPEVPWERGAELTEAERRLVARSVQTFQLGETGEGRHLLRVAAEWAEHSGDREYVEALRLFVAEEQRHAELLGRFLDDAGIPRKHRDWTDGVFRRLRHLAGLELSIAVLLTAELIALVYYAGLRRATGSRMLEAICRRLLCDEVAHVRFQAERLAILRSSRGRVAIRICETLQRLLYRTTCLVVWLTHGKVLRAGGFGLRHYWRRTGREFARALRLMDPRRIAVVVECGDSPRSHGDTEKRAEGRTTGWPAAGPSTAREEPVAAMINAQPPMTNSGDRTSQP